MAQCKGSARPMFVYLFVSCFFSSLFHLFNTSKDLLQRKSWTNSTHQQWNKFVGSFYVFSCLSIVSLTSQGVIEISLNLIFHFIESAIRLNWTIWCRYLIVIQLSLEIIIALFCFILRIGRPTKQQEKKNGNTKISRAKHRHRMKWASNTCFLVVRLESQSLIRCTFLIRFSRCSNQLNRHCLINALFVCVCERFTKNLIGVWWCVELSLTTRETQTERECETAEPHYNLWLKSFFACSSIHLCGFSPSCSQRLRAHALPCALLFQLIIVRIEKPFIIYPFTMNLHKMNRKFSSNFNVPMFGGVWWQPK